MANCVNYNCDPLGDHSTNAACAGLVMGGAAQLILLECGHGITDPSNSTQVQDAIDAGNAKVVCNVKAGFGKPSPVTQESQTSCGTPQVVTYDRAGTIKDGNISSENIDFYNALVTGRTIGGLILFECADADDDEFVTFIDAEVRVTGGRVVPDVNTAAQIFDMDFTWRSKKDPQRYAAPSGIIEANC